MRKNIVTLCILLSMGSMSATNYLKKLFHHKGDGDTSVELGNVALYLEGDPQMNVTMKKNGDQVEQIFVLSGVEAQSEESKQMIAKINEQAGDRYAVRIETITKPAKGLSITFTYNPEQLGISYDRFDSISLQKGLVVRLYNKSLLNRIKAVGKPIIRMASATIPSKVIIDAGHGGGDTGAIGCNKVQEKEVSLNVGLQVAQLLRDQGVMVVLSRDSDKTVKLDERTSCANKECADLFVSIHANAAANKTASGIETYCLQSSLFTAAGSSLPLLEQKSASEAIMQRYNQSNTLAHSVHQELLQSVSSYKTIDRKVRHAVAQVLLGTTMPSILVEVGFVTHEQESSLLAHPSYQAHLARGIANGIRRYLKRA